MQVTTTIDIDMRDVIRNLSYEEGQALILETDLAFQDVDFTSGIIKELLTSLEKDCGDTPLANQAYKNVITALEEFLEIAYT